MRDSALGSAINLNLERFGYGMLLLGCMCVCCTAPAQVFTVGEKTATADIDTSFTPTRVTLPDGAMTERGRRQLLRDFEAEQGFAHRALPMGGAGVTLIANGNLSQSGDEYKHALYEKGQAAGPGDRIVVTAMEIKGDKIVVDVNGGPYVKHRFLRHIELNGMPMANNFDEQATGARITLQFEGAVPEISAPELKALLDPVLDFGVKTSEQAYADTLPAPLKSAIASHEVLVGMNRRMVLAALGSPESKLREHGGTDSSGIKYEEWIYGHQPQTIRFVRFEGDKVTMIKVAAMGQPIEVQDKTQVAGYVDPALTRVIVSGDARPDEDHPIAAPTLKKAGETLPEIARTNKQVQMPVDNTSTTKSSNPDAQPLPAGPQMQQPVADYPGTTNGSDSGVRTQGIPGVQVPGMPGGQTPGYPGGQQTPGVPGQTSPGGVGGPMGMPGADTRLMAGGGIPRS